MRRQVQHLAQILVQMLYKIVGFGVVAILVQYMVVRRIEPGGKPLLGHCFLGIIVMRLAHSLGADAWVLGIVWWIYSSYNAIIILKK
jgi:hypothetical protein